MSIAHVLNREHGSRIRRWSMPAVFIYFTLGFPFGRVLAQTNTFPSTGNVGIGTTSPWGKLEVVMGTSDYGGVNIYGENYSAGDTATRLRLQDSTGGVAWFLSANNDGKFSLHHGGVGDRITLDTSGNVGIGTTSPPQTLSVVGTMGLSESGGTCCRLLFTTGGSGTVINHRDNSPIFFQTEDTTWLTIRNGTGNVGIGTTNPSAKLDVAGDVVVSGNISAKYQDLAEWVRSTQPIAAGSVVILDQNTDNGVLPSTQPYDARVAGVVSDSPGIVLGEGGPGKLKVATTGRVKVRVDATRAPIRRGDLLVTSEKPGAAMKSEPLEIAGRKFHQPGTLIGKALEPLSEGEGEILVLLSLQ